MSASAKLHNRLKTTFIYVTHDQTEAMTMGTRIVIMNGGEIQTITASWAKEISNLFDILTREMF